MADARENRFQIQVRGDDVLVSGELNEYSDFSMLANHPTPLTLNLKGVTRLNSIGIRNLLKFLAEWGDKAFGYRDCPSEFVDQINMIPALKGSQAQAEIQSVFVPYDCPACDAEQEIYLEKKDFGVAAEDGVDVPCSGCGTKMTLISDAFFAFLPR